MMHVSKPNGGVWDIRVDINYKGVNVPIAKHTAVLSKEMAAIGPHVCSAISHIKRKSDFFASVSTDFFAKWNIKSIDKEFDHFKSIYTPCVASNVNDNLTSA